MARDVGVGDVGEVDEAFISLLPGEARGPISRPLRRAFDSPLRRQTVDPAKERLSPQEARERAAWRFDFVLQKASAEWLFVSHHFNLVWRLEEGLD